MDNPNSTAKYSFKIKRIYFNSNGGSWMKTRIELLGTTFVLDEFYIKNI